MLVQCLYASRALENITDATLSDILATSRPKNSRCGVTGMLCHTETVFLQILEGGRDQVSALLNRLMLDTRHRDVTILVYEEIEQRTFSDWSMGQAKVDTLNLGHLLKYSPTLEINPFEGPGRAMLAMMLDMRAHGRILHK